MVDVDNTIQMNLFDYFLESDSFTVAEATEAVQNVRQLDVNRESIRARIYEGVDKGIFKKLSRGVYAVSSQLDSDGGQTTCLLVNGDGRDLSMIEDGSIDGIVTDHPYKIPGALMGGNRKLATYELFKYQEKDFAEKRRVLKQGGFLVEFLPEESEFNYEYLYEVKSMAIDNGFKYFSKVPWVKGDFVANTGRKAKNFEDVMIFSKGEPRTLKPDQKKNLAIAREAGLDTKGLDSQQVKELLIDNGCDVAYMKGTSGMLPTSFVHQPRSRADKVMEAEKPVDLLKDIIGYISKPYETLLDQFAGSGNFVVAAAEMKRNVIAIEKSPEMFKKLRANVEAQLDKEFDLHDCQAQVAASIEDGTNITPEKMAAAVDGVRSDVESKQDIKESQITDEREVR